MSNDWSKLILGDDNSQTAPICNGQVRDLLDELATLKRQRDMLLDALKEIAARNEIQSWFNLDQARAAIAAVEEEK